MGYALLWIENLAVALFFVAAMTSVIARMRKKWVRNLCASGLIFVASMFYLFISSGLILNTYLGHITLWLFHPFLALSLFAIGGGFWLALHSMLPSKGGLAGPRAAAWPRGKLFAGFFVALALQMITFWNMDQNVKQRMATLRVEWSAVAQSLMPPHVPDRDNAAIPYQQAFDLIEKEHKTWDKSFYRWFDDATKENADTPFDFKTAEVRRFFNERVEIFSLLHRASDRSICSFERDFGPPGWPDVIDKSHSTQFREASRLLWLDARVKAAAGDMPGALRDCRTLAALSEHLTEESLMIPFQVSVAINSVTCDALEAVLNTSLPTTADINTFRLDEDFIYRRAFHRAMQMENVFGQSALYLQNGLGQAPTQEMKDVYERHEFALIFYRVFLLEDDMKAYADFLRKSCEATTYPYATLKHKLSEMGKSAPTDNTLVYQFSLSLRVFSETADVAARADAQRNLMKTAVAVYKYRADKNAWPETLDNLVPAYLESVPEDPFDGKPLRMTKTDEKIILYSVGPDEKDDGGGTPYDSKAKSGDFLFTIKTRRVTETAK